MAAKLPAMAAAMGDAAASGADDAAAGDEDRAALEDAGKALLAAFSAGDPIAIAKAAGACARLAPNDTGEEDAEGAGSPLMGG